MIESKEIKCFSDYIYEIDNLDKSSQLILFRGQAVKGNLLPSICRATPHIDSTKTEKEILTELRRMGSSLLPNPKIPDWDLLVVAQHFGLKTRLLDWSSNPLTALWFACSGNEKGDVYVYVLYADEFLNKNDKGPFDKGTTRVFRPSLNNPRIIAQHGWFTSHKFSTKSKRFVALEKNTEIKKSVFEIRVPELLKDDMLKALDRYGVNSHTLFPDLEGLCDHLNWQHKNT